MQLFCKWRKNSFFFVNGRQSQFFENGRRPYFVGQRKTKKMIKKIIQPETLKIETKVVAPLRVTYIVSMLLSYAHKLVNHKTAHYSKLLSFHPDLKNVPWSNIYFPPNNPYDLLLSDPITQTICGLSLLYCTI